MIQLDEQFRSEMKAGGRGSHGTGDFGVRRLIGGNVIRQEVGLASGFAAFENVRRQGGATEGIEVKIFHERADHQLASGNGFFDPQARGWGRGALDGVWK
jgi:hypothetical protein